MKSYYGSALLVLMVAAIVMSLVSDVSLAGGIMFDDIGPQHAVESDGDQYAFRHEHINPQAPA
jgi:hypothetical protein